MRTDLGLTPLADQVAEFAISAARAKKSSRETRRRVSAGVLVALMEARRSGLQAAINAIGFHGSVEARNAISRQMAEEERPPMSGTSIT